MEMDEQKYPNLIETLVWCACSQSAGSREEHTTPDIKHQGQACDSPNYIYAGVIQVGQKLWLVLHNGSSNLRQILGRLAFQLQQVNKANNFKNRRKYLKIPTLISIFSSAYCCRVPFHDLEWLF